MYGYGLGHATRCEAIINELKTENKIIASENAYDYFNKKEMKPYKINSFKIGSMTKSFSWFQTLFENIDLPFSMVSDYNIIKKINNEFKPDVIISDTEPVSMMFAQSALIKNYFLSNIIPITKEYKKMPEKLKNPKLDSQEAVIKMVLDMALRKNTTMISPTIKKYEIGSKIKFTDLIVRKKPSELKSNEEIIKENNLPKDYVLVSFGGAQITNEYYKTIIPILKQIKNHEFIISTNNAVNKVTKKENITLYPFINDYLSMLKASKAVISLAGHSTISESLVYNKPGFVIPINDHIEQLTNAWIIENEGYGKTFLHPNELKNNILKKEIKEFLNNITDYEKNIKKTGFTGKGSTEIAKIISKV